MDLISFQETLQNYYRRPSRALAVEAIGWYVTAPHSIQVEFHQNPCNIALYAFTRLAELHPELIREYENLFERASPWGKRFLAHLLAHCGDELSVTWAKGKQSLVRLEDLERLADGRHIDGIPMLPIQTAMQLDFWWTEFFLTGERAAVAEIANCLRQPSVLHGMLQKWLSRRGIFTWLNSRRRRRAIDKLEQQWGIVCQQSQIQNLEDLDCLCLQDEPLADIQYRTLAEVANDLPFSVRLQVRQQISIKILAKWSLFSNALQHEIVRDFCLHVAEAATEQTPTTTQLTFLDLAATIHVAKGDRREALTLARRAINMDPLSRRFQRMARMLETEEEIQALFEAVTPDGRDASDNQLNMKDLLEDCIEQTHKATSYASERRVTMETDREPTKAVWRLAFEKPDRLEVHQSVGDKHDLWFTINGRTFHQFHLMMQIPQPDVGDEPAINQKLLVDNVLDHLAAMKVRRCGVSDAGRGYMVLIGELPSVPDFVMEFGASAIDECQIEVWIDKDFAKMVRLAKCSLRAGSVTIEQAFWDYNETRVSLDEFR